MTLLAGWCHFTFNWRQKVLDFNIKITRNVGFFGHFLGVGRVATEVATNGGFLR